MATIVYGVAGEGRGHAGRALSLIESLGSRHRVVVYTSGQALALMTPSLRRHGVEVRHAPEVRFAYSRGDRVDYVRTFLQNLPLLRNLDEVTARYGRELAALAPDLVITDFEPILPRAAQRIGVPYISVDHQHFLVTSDLGHLPWELQGHAAFMAPFVRAFYHQQEETIVSSFFRTRLNGRLPHVTQVGVMLRDDVLYATRDDRGHLVAYVRRNAPRHVFERLLESGRPVEVYGLGARPSMANLRFWEVDARRFVEHLATATALVTTAGNQLVGEALYLGKPVLAMSEPGNMEQRIHSHLLEEMGCGLGCAMEALSPGLIRRFLYELPNLRRRIDPAAFHGNPVVLARIEARLECSTPIAIAEENPCIELSPTPARSYGIADAGLTRLVY